MTGNLLTTHVTQPRDPASLKYQYCGNCHLYHIVVCVPSFNPYTQRIMTTSIQSCHSQLDCRLSIWRPII